MEFLSNMTFMPGSVCLWRIIIWSGYDLSYVHTPPHLQWVVQQHLVWAIVYRKISLQTVDSGATATSNNLWFCRISDHSLFQSSWMGAFCWVFWMIVSCVEKSPKPFILTAIEESSIPAYWLTCEYSLSRARVCQGKILWVQDTVTLLVGHVVSTKKQHTSM